MRSCSLTIVLLATFGLLRPPLPAQTTGVPKPAIIVSGFEPFGGRTENASWTLAQAIAENFPHEVRAVQVPVVWGAPLETINNVQPLPQVWIAFGEGTAEFQIEILAHNQRGTYPDNNHRQPATPQVVMGGDAELQQKAEVTALSAALSQAGFPTRVSKNAGNYLCEEMLYSLLHSQKQHPEALRLVLFIHVPTLEHTVQIPAGSQSAPHHKQRVDAVWLEAFGKQLFASLRTLGLLTQHSATK